MRDAFLGRPVNDLDFTTDATPDEILAIVKPIADAHWDIGRAFGTIGARIAGETVEITTYRADAYDGDTPQARGRVRHERSRTTSCAATSRSTRSRCGCPKLELVDPSGGVEDLARRARCARRPRPSMSFGDDPLRMMRAARFAAQLGFDGRRRRRAQAMRDLADRASTHLGRAGARRAVEAAADADAAPAASGCSSTSGLAEQRAARAARRCASRSTSTTTTRTSTSTASPCSTRRSSYETSRGGLDAPDLVAAPRRAAARHRQAGDPALRAGRRGQLPPPRRRRREARAQAAARAALRQRHDRRRSSRLIELHLRFFGYTDGAWTDSAVRRYVRDAGDQLERLHILTRADVTTRNRRKADRLGFAYDDLEERIAALAEEEELDAVRPDLDGEQIMALLGHHARAARSARRTASCSSCGSTRVRSAPRWRRERLRAWWAAR